MYALLLYEKMYRFPIEAADGAGIGTTHRERTPSGVHARRRVCSSSSPPVPSTVHCHGNVTPGPRFYLQTYNIATLKQECLPYVTRPTNRSNTGPISSSDNVMYIIHESLWHPSCRRKRVCSGYGRFNVWDLEGRKKCH